MDEKVHVRNYSPPFRTFFTDITAPLFIQQHFGRCAFFEMRFMECLEAYGADLASQKCTLQRDDYHECLTGERQKLRCKAMMEERKRQNKAAGLKDKDPAAYVQPIPRDSYTFMDSH